MNRIPADEVQRVLERILSGLGMMEARARRCARLFVETTCDGVYTHGVSRFPRFVATIRNGCVDVAAEARRVTGTGAVERWDGQMGPGNLNAYACMERAMEMSRVHGIGCVSLGNTNHWMRGGTYGWQAAEAGLIAICWTNTMPNLPPWGATEPCIGNNPLVIAVPRVNGAVVLDMAMSQFSYGALESYRKRGEMLPVGGGFDTTGRLTRDPGAIEASQRALPVGYWKGSGLSIVLDMMAAALSLGRATHQIQRDSLREAGVSQVFVAMDPAAFGAQSEAGLIVDGIVDSLHACGPAQPQEKVRYPGERTLRTRAENRRLGLPVDPALWNEIRALEQVRGGQERTGQERT